MHDPGENKFVPLSPELAARLDGDRANLTDAERLQRNWTRFEEGETLIIKGIKFKVHEIGESRLVLKLINQS